MFDRDRSVIGRHVRDAFAEGELPREGSVRILPRIPEGGRPGQIYVGHGAEREDRVPVRPGDADLGVVSREAELVGAVILVTKQRRSVGSIAWKPCATPDGITTHSSGPSTRASTRADRPGSGGRPCARHRAHVGAGRTRRRGPGVADQASSSRRGGVRW